MQLMKLLAGGLLSLAATVAIAEEPNTRTVTEQFKSWRYACIEQGDASRCEIGQAAVNEQGQMVSQIIIGKNLEGKGQVQIIAPLMMDLKAGMQVMVDQQQLAELDYLFCNQGSCVVAELLTKDMLGAMKAGNDMQINIAAISGQTMTITYSLSGFSAAYARLMGN